MTRSTGEPRSQAKKRVLGLRRNVDRRRPPKREEENLPLVQSSPQRLRVGKPGDRHRGDRDPATRTALAGETSLDECCGCLLHAILGLLVCEPRCQL
jgi:hypothetical protein